MLAVALSPGLRSTGPQGRLSALRPARCVHFQGQTPPPAGLPEQSHSPTAGTPRWPLPGSRSRHILCPRSRCTKPPLTLSRSFSLSEKAAAPPVTAPGGEARAPGNQQGRCEGLVYLCGGAGGSSCTALGSHSCRSRQWGSPGSKAAGRGLVPKQDYLRSLAPMTRENMGFIINRTG